ncbi:hypothetical protein Rhsp01_49050 [Rhizobium sp. NBRC 114257]|uniref:Uncharacterized protein n=1 Tax=Rhizobium dioscoreae TaxID=2653122 RepID=A0ABQ0ZAV5_9HYPH|nr:hypothetical protein RsS93_50180 [Rhizobium dioscoreae]GLU83729.1 hypothetical protein Rhsp01_49050 [Rhizobium sp. NBRC 114257]
MPVQGMNKLSERLARIPDQAQRLIIAADLLRIDINVDHLSTSRNLPPAIRAILIGSGSNQNDKVCLADESNRMAPK